MATTTARPGDIFHTTVASLNRSRYSWAFPGLIGCATFVATGWPFVVNAEKYGHEGDVALLPVAMVVNYADGESTDAERDFIDGHKPPSHYAPLDVLEPGPDTEEHPTLAARSADHGDPR